MIYKKVRGIFILGLLESVWKHPNWKGTLWDMLFNLEPHWWFFELRKDKAYGGIVFSIWHKRRYFSP